MSKTKTTAKTGGKAQAMPELIKAEALEIGLKVCDSTNEILTQDMEAVACGDYSMDILRGQTLLLDHINANRLNQLQGFYFLDQALALQLQKAGKVLSNKGNKANGVAVGFFDIVTKIVEDSIHSGRALEVIDRARDSSVEFLKRDLQEQIAKALGEYTEGSA